MKVHALSIGISTHASATGLNYAREDASAFHELILANAGADVGMNIILVDSSATLAAFRTALDSPQLQEIAPDDIFFFFYSGHGAVAPGGTGDETVHYLVPYDATSNAAASCVAVSYINERLRGIRATRKFVFIDSCFSGAMSSEQPKDVSAKYLEYPQAKTPLTKSFQEELEDTGSIIFTACAEAEVAWEHPDLKHGVFTHYLIDELTKGRVGNSVAFTDIYDPVVQSVKNFSVTRCNRLQTPTANLRMVGSVHLPVLQTRPHIHPDVLSPPAGLKPSAPTIPRISLSDKQKEQLLNDIQGLVSAAFTNPSPFAWGAVEVYASDVIGKLREKWEAGQAGPGVAEEKVKSLVENLEVNSTELLALFAYVARFGTEEQLIRLTELVLQIAGWGVGRSGLTALLEAGDVILLDVLYVVGAVSIAANRISQYVAFLSVYLIDPTGTNDPQPLYAEDRLHYADALGGSATAVGHHALELLKNLDWLEKVSPGIKGNEQKLFVQTNFLVCVAAAATGEIVYASFGAYWAGDLRPLTFRLKHDQVLIGQVARLMNMPTATPREVRARVAELLVQLQVRHREPFSWHSIGQDDILPASERPPGV